MPTDKKTNSTTPQVEVGTPPKENQLIRNHDTLTKSKIVGNAKTSLDHIKHAPDAQDTGFRIQQQQQHVSQSSIPNDDRKESSFSSDRERNTNHMKTTIHFASGLTLPISSNHAALNKTMMITKTAAKPKIVTNYSYLRPSSSYPQTPVAVVHKKEGDDVHDQFHFTALKSATTTTHSTLPQSPVTEGDHNDDFDKQRKKTAQDKVIESKKTAARAMMAQRSVVTDTSISNHSNNDRSSYMLLKHLQMKLESASSNIKADGKVTSSILDSSVSIAFYLESAWVNYEMGVQFLQDILTVLQHELIKAKDSSLSTSEYKPLFLVQNDDCLPEWLKQHMHSMNPEVSSLLCLLSQVESAVLKSYESTCGQSLTYIRIHSPVMSNIIEHDTQQKMFTPPTTPLVKSSRVSVDGSVDCFHTPREVDSLEGGISFKVTPERMQNSSSRDVACILSTANVATLQLRELLRTKELKDTTQNVINLMSHNFTRLSFLDFHIVLSPAQNSMDATQKRKGDIVTDIWNKIIGSARKVILLSARTNLTDGLELIADDEEVLELFGDDGFITSSVRKKKKKKNNKKKKKKHSQVNDHSVPVSQHIFIPEEIKNVTSDSAVTSQKPDSFSSSGVISSSNTNVSKNHLIADVDVQSTTSYAAHNVQSVPTNGISKENKESKESDSKEIQNENDGWETVEHKGSNRLKRIAANAKAVEKLNISNQNAQVGTSNGRKKGKNKRRNKNKESVKSGEGGNEVKKTNSTKGDGELKKKIEPANPNVLVTNSSQSSVTTATSKPQIRPLKDVLMSNIPKVELPISSNCPNTSDASRAQPIKPVSSSKPAVADQNTASTGPETLSAASKTKLFKDMATESPSRANINSNDLALEASVIETKDNSTNSSTTDETSTRRVTINTKNSVPPFSTLVGPSNINSADSSVASSLEAPHATRHGVHHHHHQKHPTEDDVGYHLLKVCEKLSTDMDIFMSRRSAALTIRRRERRDLLASLQDIVQNIWPERCKVEMYGSCATRLDLPSSDLDVVVCGLDRHESGLLAKRESTESGKHVSSPRYDQPSIAGNHHHPHFIPLSVNGNRVMRLASELEKVPWAVQVKPIPTASVPVIKILADPSRLPGCGQIDWMLQQQHLSVAATGMMSIDPRSECALHNHDVATVQRLDNQKNDRCSSKAIQGFLPTNPSYPNSSPPWRGADVMNGLLSLDITFEGPEHGGLGSTAFSARVIQEASNESGLPPESTPAVKVLMVIKELLAQRRLNEPFSGGLSSYAILLLLVAVIKERRIIRKEIERVERQQLAVTSLSVAAASDVNTTAEISKQTTARTTSESESQSIHKSASWAAIAMRSNDSITADNESHSNQGQKEITSQYSIENEHSTNDNDDDDDESIQGSTLFPQGSNDVLEVLCSGEPTAGKLLMHFLLFYGRHFDASTTCIDITGTHHPDYKKTRNKLQSISHLSPYINRKPGGMYNPLTDVYTVDPIIIYDPLKGSESNNVSRTCFAWENIRWTFEQCYNTLSGVVELGAGSRNRNSKTWPVHGRNDRKTDSDDLSVQPLLELLLSF